MGVVETIEKPLILHISEVEIAQLYFLVLMTFLFILVIHYVPNTCAATGQ